MRPPVLFMLAVVLDARRVDDWTEFGRIACPEEVLEEVLADCHGLSFMGVDALVVRPVP